MAALLTNSEALDLVLRGMMQSAQALPLSSNLAYAIQRLNAGAADFCGDDLFAGDLASLTPRRPRPAASRLAH